MRLESHVTLKPPYGEKVRKLYLDTAEKLGYKTSWIYKDPILGDKDFFYFTAYDDDFTTAVARMDQAQERLSEFVVRKKVEGIMYDVRL